VSLSTWRAVGVPRSFDNHAGEILNPVANLDHINMFRR
jgi:hypothetical protein